MPVAGTRQQVAHAGCKLVIAAIVEGYWTKLWKNGRRDVEVLTLFTTLRLLHEDKTS